MLLFVLFLLIKVLLILKTASAGKITGSAAATGTGRITARRRIVAAAVSPAATALCTSDTERHRSGAAESTATVDRLTAETVLGTVLLMLQWQSTTASTAGGGGQLQGSRLQT